MDIRADGQIPYLPLHVLLTGIVKSMIETTGLENSLVRNDGPLSDRLVAPVVVQDRHAGKRMQEQPVQTRGQIGQLA